MQTSQAPDTFSFVIRVTKALQNITKRYRVLQKLHGCNLVILVIGVINAGVDAGHSGGVD